MDREAKLKLLREIKAYRDQRMSWRKISEEMGRSEKWAYVLWTRNKNLHPLLGTKVGTMGTQVDTKPPEIQPQAELSPSIKPPTVPSVRKPPPPQVDRLMKRLEQLEQRQVGYLLLPDQRRWLDKYDHHDSQTRDRYMALLELDEELAKFAARGTKHFKKGQLEDSLGAGNTFDWAWKKLREMGVIVSDKSSTAGRSLYKPLQEEG